MWTTRYSLLLSLVCLIISATMLTSAAQFFDPTKTVGEGNIAAPAAAAEEKSNWGSELSAMARRLDRVQLRVFSNRAICSGLSEPGAGQPPRMHNAQLDQLRTMGATLAKMEAKLGKLEQENADLRIILEQHTDYFKAVAGNIAPRTCEELRKLGLAKSGHYPIDPDGAGVGEDPISVFCEMPPATTEGVTRIDHSLGNQAVEVGDCEGPGCHKIPVTYNASMNQIHRLIEISGNCSQAIQYKCLSAPLTKARYPYDAVHKGSWKGADGTSNVYWDGSHSPQEHVCACKSIGNCIDTDYTCNCDSSSPVEWKEDAGVLTDGTALPVVELSFDGLSKAKKQAANLVLGSLLCSSFESAEIKPRNSFHLLNASIATPSQYCLYSMDVGTCNKNEAKWFYDKSDGVCKQFLYGGCNGNQNRFTTSPECETKCGDVQDACALPAVIGPCSRKFRQWYYDSARRRCLQFEYGGCQGNKNRFDSEAACNQRCHREDYLPPTTTPATTTTTEDNTMDPVQDAHPTSTEHDERDPQYSTSLIEATEGSLAKLPCSMPPPKGKVLWIHGNETFYSLHGRRQLLKDGSLQIAGLRTEDGGYHYCQFWDEKGALHLRRTELRVLPGREEPAQILPGQETEVVTSIGGSVVMYCLTIGFPQPSVVWLFEGTMIPFNSEKHTEDLEGALKILKVALRDLGPYTCHVYNGLGSESSRSITLRAYEPVDFYSTDASDSAFLRYVLDRRGSEGGRRGPTSPPEVQPTRGPVSSTTRKELAIRDDCTDNSFFFNCKIITRGVYCRHEYYGRSCCRTCTLAGHLIPP